VRWLIKIKANRLLRRKPVSALAIAIGLLSGSAAYAGFNIPTAQVDPVTKISKPEPSPLCIGGTDAAHCATEFTAKMFTFEEFGTFEDTSKSVGISSIDGTRTFPAPKDCTSGPDGALLDAFLSEKMNSVPLRVVDETSLSPWQAKINECLGVKTAHLLKVVQVEKSLPTNVGMSFLTNVSSKRFKQVRVSTVVYVIKCSYTVTKTVSLVKTVCIM